MSLKAGQLRELDRDELMKKLSDLSSELFKMRLEFRASRSVANPKVRNLRRDMARVLTILKEKETASDA